MMKKSIYWNLLEPLLSLSLFVIGASYSMVLVTLYLKEWNQSEEMIGLVQSAYFAGLLLGGIAVERHINRVGHIRSYAFFASFLVICVLLQGLIPDPWVWFGLRLLFGFSVAAMYVAIESWLLSTATASNRGVIMSIYMVVLYMAQTLSQGVLKWAQLGQLNLFMLSAIFIALSVLPLASARNKAPHIQKGHGVTLKRLLIASPLGFVACGIGGIVQGGMYASLPSFAIAYDYDPGFFMSAAILGGGMLQWPIGKLSDRIDRRKVLLVVSLLLLVPCALIFPFHSYESVALVLCFLMGGLSFTFYSLGIAQTCDRLDPHEITGAAAWLLVAYGVGSVLGPLIAPQFMEPSAVGLFLFYALSSSFLALFAIYSIVYRLGVAVPGPFVPQPSTTPLATELNPRVPLELPTQDETPSPPNAFL